MVNFSARFTFNSQVVLQSLHRVYSVYKASNLDHLQGLVQEQHLPVGICLLLTFFVSIRVGAQNNSRVCESVCFSKGILKTRHTLEILNVIQFAIQFSTIILQQTQSLDNPFKDKEGTQITQWMEFMDCSHSGKYLPIYQVYFIQKISSIFTKFTFSNLILDKILFFTSLRMSFNSRFTENSPDGAFGASRLGIRRWCAQKLH